MEGFVKVSDMNMSEMITTLTKYLEYPFVQKALIVGSVIALCSALLGVVLVLKRYSFIGDSLSHVAFCAMAFATIFSFVDDMVIIFPLTILCAILLLRSSSKGKMNGDASLALISVGSLALGYLFINVFSTSSNVAGDVCSTLFGTTSILTLTDVEMWLSIGLSLFVVGLFIIAYNKIFTATFDYNFARATGMNMSVYDLIMSVVIAVIIVLAMNLVGSLLISAMVIFPALTSMQLFKSFKAVTISSAIVAVFTAVLGIIVSILFGTPVGCTIVGVEIVMFIIFAIVGKIKGV